MTFFQATLIIIAFATAMPLLVDLVLGFITIRLIKKEFGK